MASFTDLCFYEDEGEVSDLQLLVAFNELRHREKIEGSKKVTQTWRMKERVSRFLVSLLYPGIPSILRVYNVFAILSVQIFVCSYSNF